MREVRLGWFGHLQKKDAEYIERRMLRMEVKEEVHRHVEGGHAKVGATEEDAENR